MTDLVVLVLVVLWIAFLAPRVVRHFRAGGPKSSIDSFHEQLHLLERTGPKLVQPAYRLESMGPAAPPSPSAGPSPGAVEQDPSRGARPIVSTAVYRRHSASEDRAGLQRRARRRRRDVLLALTGLLLVTGGLGAVHALHLLWAVTGISALAIAGYVALVAYAQMLHAERDALKPVVPGTVDLPARWAASQPRHAAGPHLHGVQILAAGSTTAARAGYPGAWDDDALVSASRRAAGG